jgi:hypothetical protein
MIARAISIALHNARRKRRNSALLMRKIAPSGPPGDIQKPHIEARNNSFLFRLDGHSMQFQQAGDGTGTMEIAPLLRLGARLGAPP